MQRLAMSLAGLFLAVTGLIVAGPRGHAFPAPGLVLAALLWAGLEFYVGAFRSFAGEVPAHPLIKASRMLWSLPVVYSWLDFRWGWTRVPLPTWTAAGIFIVLLAGLALRTWAVLHLGASFSYDLKRPAGGQLVTTGPYRFLRHPSYLGICLLGSLPGLLLGSLPGFIGMALLTVPQTLYRARREDQVLEAEFGDRFRQYRQHTSAFIPFIY